MKSTKNEESYILGPGAEIAPNVILGYPYKDWDQPLRIGDRARIHSGTVIYAGTQIGHRFTCGHNVVIRAQCEIGDRVVILHGTILEGKLKIGKGVKIMAQVYIPSGTTIGEMVFIGPGVNILNARLPMRDGQLQKVTIGHHVVIGGGVTIAPGVTIGNNVFIGAGAVVVKDIPDHTLAYGNPAKIQPLPEKFGPGNDPKQIFTGLDLWNPEEDDGTWQLEDFFGKENWFKM